MNSKEFLTRIQMKRDTSSNWVVNNPVLLDGEVVIVDTDAGAVRYKVGDGTKKFTQLPFTDENMLNLVNNKQDRLTIDATPTSGSTNPVMSGGVVSYAVPQTRTINGKALSANISLTASDVGADASGAASTALNNAKTYTNQEIASVKSLVSTTYETQSSASTKLAEAKAYTDTAVADLADADHNHDDRYFTESKLNSVLGSYETKDDASDKLATAKSYTDTKVSGLVSSSTVDSKIFTHNTASGAHSDIRAALTSLTTKVTNFLDVDEETTDQLSEVLAMIDANKGTLTSLTTSKVNVSDIVNNLTTNSTSKVLSAAQGVQIQTLISGLEDELDTHAANKSNPHAVTKAQVGLGNCDNTSDVNKPVSTAQATAIADAKAAGTTAQTNLTSHINNKSNPHSVTLAQLGVTATAAELNYMDGVTSNVQTQLNNKMSDFTIEIYNGTSGNPKPVRFASFNYSTCNSEAGIAAKISMVSGHGNGTAYAFLQDAILRVSFTGNVEVDTFKYYGAETGTYDGANRQYGDIFWLVDTTNKIVDFYCLMGQYARLYQTPWKRLTYSTGGTVTQHTSCTVYSSGTKVWANNGNIAMVGDIPTSMTPTAHNQAASTITAGTFAGQVVANGSGQTPGTSLLRNSRLVLADTNPTVNGEICWTYK